MKKNAVFAVAKTRELELTLDGFGFIKLRGPRITVEITLVLRAFNLFCHRAPAKKAIITDIQNNKGEIDSRNFLKTIKENYMIAAI